MTSRMLSLRILLSGPPSILLLLNHASHKLFILDNKPLLDTKFILAIFESMLVTTHAVLVIIDLTTALLLLFITSYILNHYSLYYSGNIFFMMWQNIYLNVSVSE
jgi:hypothetical protein